MIDLEPAPSVRSRAVSGHLYVRPPVPIDFPAFEAPGEEVSESKRHLENRTALYLVLKDLLAATASIGSDQFVYYNPTDARKCLSPDAFVRLDVPDRPFRVWKTWEQGAPDLGVEIISASDQRDDDWEDKLARYRAAGIRDLVRFDAEDLARPIRIWDQVSGDLVERAEGDPALRFCHTLGLWWVVVEDKDYGPTLRLARDPGGRELLATPAEARMRAEMAHREAQQALVVAEHEKLVAEQARRDAEQAWRDAEHKLHDESEARRRAETEIERLKEALATARRGQ